MIVTRVETSNFRNLDDLALAPHPRFNVLCGDNAQGKTNFLEAVYMLACQRSFRAGKTVELIRFGEQRAQLRGEAEVGPLTRELKLELKPEGRRVLVDGKGRRAGSPALEGLAAVLFCPDDLWLPRGAPGDRRRFIDRAIANIWSGYTALGRDYQKTVQSRNRLLRDDSPKRSLLEVYDGQLVALGAKIIVARRRYLERLAEEFSATFARIAQSGVQALLTYQCEPEVTGAENEPQAVASALSALLERRREVELARHTTMVGPHTHDLEFSLDGQPARRFGSQGQVRAIVLAFRITQIIDSHRKLGHYPLLLLDDVSSELDPARNGYLFDFLEKISCQVFLTTTRADLVPVTENRIDFKVFNGSIERWKCPLLQLCGCATSLDSENCWLIR